MEHRISDAWERYKLDRMAVNSSIYQQQELRRAFYAGAKVIIEEATRPDLIAEQVLFDAGAECKLFAQQARAVRR